MRALKRIQQMRELVQRMGIYMVCFFVFIANHIVGVYYRSISRGDVSLLNAAPLPPTPIYIDS